MPERALDNYREITIAVDPAIEEPVCNFIIEHVTSGLLLEDEEESGLLLIKFYLPEDFDTQFDKSLNEFLGQVSRQYGVAIPDLSEAFVANRSWEDEYRKSIRPVEIGDKIIVRPTWDETVSAHAYQIKIEPKMAFGTGTHETTRSCLLAIVEHLEPEMSFLDVGCGSGILSILADQIGASYIKAVDYDQVAVDNCLENFIINQVTSANKVICGTIADCLDDSPYGFVCANIIRKTILEILDDLISLTADRGKLLLSGLLDIDLPEVESGLRARGLTDYEIYPDNEWRTLVIFKG